MEGNVKEELLTSNALKPRIALCLSGGGLRATFFHAGVIKLLRSAELLRNVTHICAVSGGSILAAHLVTNWEKYNGTDKEYSEMEAELLKLGGRDLRGRVIRRWILAWIIFPAQLFSRFRRSRLLEREYASLYGHTVLNQLAGERGVSRPELHIMATSFATGQLYSFSHAGLWAGTSKAPTLHAADSLPLARAVAASSSFPPLFPPVVLTSETLGTRDSKLPFKEYLTDGGVFDNLGIEKISRLQASGEAAFDQLLLSDASAQLDWDTTTHSWWLGPRTVRTTDILMQRVSDASLSNATLTKHGAVASHISISESGANPIAGAKVLPADLQQRISMIRTDLDRFSPTEMELLVRHGYEVAYKRLEMEPALHAAVIKAGPYPVSKPYDGEKITSLARLLTKAQHRRLRLLDFRDWVTYFLTGCLVLILISAYLPFAYQRLELRQKAAAELRRATAPRGGIPSFTVTIPEATSNVQSETASKLSVEQANLIFANQTAETVNLYWIDFNGDAVLNSELAPYTQTEVQSYVGHLWSAKNSEGAILMKFVVPPKYIEYSLSGTFEQGYRLSPESMIVIDTTSGKEISARILVEGPNAVREEFVGEPNYNTDRMWQWQNQGSLGGSLDFQDQKNTFIRYLGGAVLSNSAYWTPALGHNITSSDTTFQPILNSKTP
jgi:predicted acylesterase/phospholipase RssA